MFTHTIANTDFEVMNFRRTFDKNSYFNPYALQECRCSHPKKTVCYVNNFTYVALRINLNIYECSLNIN